MYKVIGIDEAGKGPVIGSLFIAFSTVHLAEGLSALNDYQDKLEQLGVKDSKKLTPKKRGELYTKLKEYMDIFYAQLTPAVIDDNNKSGFSLNDLEIASIIQILEKEKPNLVLIDALTSSPENFGEEISKRLSFDCKIISENKADTKYPIVGAASIAAKQLREQELEEIRTNIGYNCGSGYPSDPTTKEFLKQHYNSKEFDFIFRKSWKTYQNLIKENLDKTIDEFIDKEVNEKEDNTK